jgi:ATP-binding cassette subfamily C protein LapB
MSEVSTNNVRDSLLESLVLYTRLFHKPFTAESLLSGLPVNETLRENVLFSKDKSKSLFSRAAARAGLVTTIIQRPIADILDIQLPVILMLSHDNNCILESFSEDRKQAKIIYAGEDAAQEWVDVEKLESEYLGFAFMLKKEFEYSEHQNGIYHLDEKKHWFWSTLGLSKEIYYDCILASIIINLFVLAIPLYTLSVYDRVIPNNAQETLWVFTIGVLFVLGLDSFVKFTRSYFLELAAKRNDVIISSILFEKVLDLKLEFHPKSIGSFANNIKDFDSLRNFLTSATLSILIDLPFTIIFLLTIYYIGGIIVLVPLCIIVIIIFYVFMIKDKLQDTIKSTHEAAARKNGILVESLHNIETLKALGLASPIQWKWEEAIGEIAKKSLKARLTSSTITNVTTLLVHLNTVLVIVVGVYLIQDIKLTMGGLIATVILASRAITPMGQFVALITNYEDAKASYELLNEIVNHPVERPFGKEFVHRRHLEGNIEFRNVSFKYPNSKIYALRNVSFTINKGDKVAIIGRNGSGKSTIAKLILKLYEPTEGSILIDGIDISQLDPADIRKQIGYVPQEVLLFKGSVKENILGSSKFVDDEHMLKASKLSNLDEFIKLHPDGYELQIAERGVGLSGGQKQSIALSRALVEYKNIYLFDEPTNSMDQTTENIVENNLKEYLKDATLLMVTQKKSMLDLVERVIVIHQGAKVFDGSKEESLKH